MIDPRTVAASYVRTLLEVLEARGVARAVMLHGLPLEDARLANPSERVALGLVVRLWERGVALTGDPGLGLALGMRARPTTFHVLGHATMSCATLGEALEVMLRYQRLVSEAGVLSATRERSRVTITYRPNPGIPLLPVQVEGILSGLVGQARFLTGRSLAPARVAFTHARQAAESAYLEAFGVAPDFESALDEVVLTTRDLAAPLPQPDAAMHQLFCRMADSALVALPPVGFVSGFARQWLRTRPAGSARVEALADALGTSTRSLQRQLGAESTSWTHLVDEARRESARAMLAEGKTLDATARALGYHDASSLSRALRRWSRTESTARRKVSGEGVGQDDEGRSAE